MMFDATQTNQIIPGECLSIGENLHPPKAQTRTRFAEGRIKAASMIENVEHVLDWSIAGSGVIMHWGVDVIVPGGIRCTAIAEGGGRPTTENLR